MKTKPLTISLAFIYTIISFPSFTQGFYGTFDLNNWQFSAPNGGSVDFSSQPNTINLTGPNNAISGTADFYIVYGGNCPATISFSWSISNHPDCGYDSLFYGVNTNFTFLADCDSAGTVGPLQINPGDQLTLRIETPDGEFGSPTAVINNFLNASIVPVNSQLTTITSPCRIDSLTPPLAVDGCGVTFSGIPNFSFPIESSTTIGWDFVDADGNYLVQTQQIYIEDFDAPIPNVDSLVPMAGYCELTPVQPGATDACGGVTYVSCSHSFPISTIGNTTITWTYSDFYGNSSTQQQIITVEEIPNTLTANGSYLQYPNPINGALYQWIDCETGMAISGETQSSILPQTPDHFYSLEITLGNCSVTTECVSISTAGLTLSMDNNFLVYPNPANELLFIHGNISSIDEITMTDLAGRVFRPEVQDIDEETSSISVVDLASGVYITTIETKFGSFAVKTIVGN